MDPAPTRPHRRTTRGVAAAALLAVLAITSSACERDVPEAAPEPVRLGLLLPLTGGSAASGRAMEAAARMTVEDVNAAGGVLGRPVELVVADDACDPQTAVLAANELVRADVVASVGGYCSSATVPTLKVFDAAGVPMVIPAANSSDLLTPGYPGVFLLGATVDSEAAVAVPWMASLGATRIAFVHDGTSYSLKLAEAAAAVASAPGSGVVTATSLQVSQGSTDLGSTARAVLGSGADLVYYTGYEPDAVQLATDLDAAGYTGEFMGADGVVGDVYLAEAPRLLGRDVFATVPPLAEHTEGAGPWAERFVELTGEAAIPYTLQQADAVTLVLDAITRAGVTDGAAVTSAIAATDALDLLSGPCSFADGNVRLDVPFTLLRAGASGVVSEATGT